MTQTVGLQTQAYPPTCFTVLWYYVLHMKKKGLIHWVGDFNFLYAKYQNQPIPCKGIMLSFLTIIRQIGGWVGNSQGRIWTQCLTQNCPGVLPQPYFVCFNLFIIMCNTNIMNVVGLFNHTIANKISET